MPGRHSTHPWWQVMCLTGVDYFSTLGYQPGIAALAAGVLSPLATLVLVVVTLVGALPVYRRVAVESPHGEGSIAMLERVLPFWRGKLFVLTLLGFAATDFVITMTLSAADATAHLLENPLAPRFLAGHRTALTLALLALLGAVFLRGFGNAIGIAVGLVTVYLALNAVVVARGLVAVATHPSALSSWTDALTRQYPDPLAAVALSLLLFPRLALGLSGFETGVAVMPLVAGDPGDTEQAPSGRIRGTRRLLTTAAVLMSGYLVTSSIITALLVPAHELEPGGSANGRALAYLAHAYLGRAFGTVYDLSTIAILWFAGASAMAGLLNLVPRYLPRYGMAPEWTRAVRPLVLVFTAVGFAITWLFDASVDAQGGAYATGVLVLITSAAVAVTLSARRRGSRRAEVGFGAVSLIFAYTTAVNVVERPEGVKIGTLFVVAIIALSLLSRLTRSFETRVTGVQLDDAAERFVRDAASRRIRFVAHRPGDDAVSDYQSALRDTVARHDIADQGDVIFLKVTVSDPSDFATELQVHGEVQHGRYRVLTATSPSAPAAIAALLLHARDLTGRVPHVYFAWTEGNPFTQLLHFLFFGQGEVAPVTREILREAEPDTERRPHVHVG